MNQTAVNDELEGSLIHNHTYFVTIKVLNTAEVMTTYEAEGMLLHVFVSNNFYFTLIKIDK